MGAFMGLKVVNSVAPIFSALGSAFQKIASAGIEKLTGLLPGFGSGMQTAGTTSATTGTQMLQASFAFIALGGGIMLAAFGIKTLALGAMKLALDAIQGSLSKMAGTISQSMAQSMALQSSIDVWLR